MHRRPDDPPPPPLATYAAIAADLVDFVDRESPRHTHAFARAEIRYSAMEVTVNVRVDFDACEPELGLDVRRYFTFNIVRGRITSGTIDLEHEETPPPATRIALQAIRLFTTRFVVRAVLLIDAVPGDAINLWSCRPRQAPWPI